MLNYQRVDQHVPMGNRQDSSLVALMALVVLLGPGLSVFSFFSGASAILRRGLRLKTQFRYGKLSMFEYVVPSKIMVFAYYINRYINESTERYCTPTSPKFAGKQCEQIWSTLSKLVVFQGTTLDQVFKEIEDQLVRRLSSQAGITVHKVWNYTSVKTRDEKPSDFLHTLDYLVLMVLMV